MKRTLALALIIVGFAACKNNGGGTTSKAKKVIGKEILVDANRKPPAQRNFRVYDMLVEGDILKVVFQYSGGCEEHDFLAYFNGGWLKSMPPQVVLDFDHLNPNNDSCREMVKDTVQFNLNAVKHPGGNEVVIKCASNKRTSVTYKY